MTIERILEEAVACALDKVKYTMQRFWDKFPHVSVSGHYLPLENVEWTAGFWTGILWLLFLSTGDSDVRALLEQRLVPSFASRLSQNVNVDTHDLGFLYLLSCVPAFEFLGNQTCFEVACEAAERLAGRFRPKGKYIQAFGKITPRKRETVTIIDSLMNLPLLYWAARRTERDSYRHIAVQHAQTIASLLVRTDGATYQACRFQGERPTWLGTIQGYSATSCWSRGQAWAIYGFALSYRYTGMPFFLEKALQVSEYFLSHLPHDRVCYWDLGVAGTSEPRDSSAAAIAVSGILELALALETVDRERAFYLRQEALSILQNLIQDYASCPSRGNDGLLLHATYHLPKRWGIDESCIWGDYFYLESLLKVKGGFASLWFYA